MVKSYLPLRSIDKKTGKPKGPILMAEIKNKPKKTINGYYFDGKNSYTLYKAARIVTGKQLLTINLNSF